ncbi:MAG: hypothetical protein J4A00_07875 [Gammaproteobacteria bacterium]|nr:hypothetical protein [Gammaproteobacteria bacterium]
MKLLLILLVALALGAGIGLLLQGEPGYLMIAHGNWRIETSVIVALLAVAGLFLLLHGVSRLITWGIGAGPRWRGWRSRRRRSIAHSELTRGVTLLLEGQWPQAEKRLGKHLNDSEVPLLNHLALAWAAQEQGDIDRRNHHLNRASRSNPKAEVAVALIQAESQYRSGEIEQALATTQQIVHTTPKHPWGLRLLAKIRYQVGDWHGLLTLLPALVRYAKLPTDEAAALTRECHLALLGQSIELADGHWQSLPKTRRAEPELLLGFCNTLVKADQGLRAERLLLNGLEQTWDSRLLEALVALPSEEPTARLHRLERWLPDHPDDPQLLLATAIACRDLELWGKARSLLEQGIALNSTREGRYQLAELLLQLGENEAALGQFKEAALMAETNPESINQEPNSTAKPGHLIPGLKDNLLPEPRFRSE